MIFTIGLKRICDVCFYMTFASLVGVWVGGTNLIATLPIFAMTALLSAFLEERGSVKYVSFLLLSLCFFVVPFQLGNILVLLPAFIYMVYATTLKPNERSNQVPYTEVFKLFFKLFVGLILVAFILQMLQVFQVQAILEQSVLPFGIAFFLCVITLLRMLRHDEQVLSQHFFKLMNVFSLVGLLVGAIVISSDTFLNALGGVIHAFYFQMFLPTFSFLFNGLLFLLSFIPDLPFIPPRYEIIVVPYEERGEDFANFQPEGTDYSSVNGEFFTYALYFIVIIAVVFIVLKIFRHLTQKYSPVYTMGRAEIRTELSNGKKISRKERQQVKHQIREVYRKYLQLCVNKGIHIEPYMTSLDIEDVAVSKFACVKSKELREIYIKVRYRDDTDYSKEDMKRAKTLLKEVRREWNEK